MGNLAIRATDGISANIAEGYGRYHFRDKLIFFYYARGSFEETKSWVRKLHRRKLLSKEQSHVITELIMELGPLLNSFITTTKGMIKP